MKNGKKIITFTVVVLLLGIGFFIVRQNRQNVPAAKVGELTVKQGVADIETFNVIGMVKTWDGETRRLVTIAGEGENTYIIDPVKTKVMVGLATNKYKDSKLNIINKQTQPMHWNSAFCPGDQVSLLLEKTTGEVVWAMDTDLRSCGFKGDF